MGKQGHGRRLTDKERMEIIELTRQNPRIKHVELASKYEVNESTIRKWRMKANAERIQQRYGNGLHASRDARQRGQAVKNEAFDATLYEWICGMRKQGKETPPVKIREKARALATSFEGMEGFKASSGWYYRFCRRYGLPCPSSQRVSTNNRSSSANITISSSAMEQQEHESSASGGSSNTLAVQSDVAAISSERTTEPVETLATETAFARSSSVAELTMKLVAGETDATARDLLLGLGETSTENPDTSKFMTIRQEAIAHFLHYHKDLLDVTCRLKFIKHLAHFTGEAEMYTVMDADTRVAYIRDFAEKHNDPVVGSTGLAI